MRSKGELTPRLRLPQHVCQVASSDPSSVRKGVKNLPPGLLAEKAFYKVWKSMQRGRQGLQRSRAGTSWGPV